MQSDVTLKQTSPQAAPSLIENYGKLPLSFESNQGQTDAQVKFLSRGSGYSLFLTRNEAVLALKKKGKRASQGSHFEPAALATRKRESQREAVLRMRLVGANATSQVTGLEELPGKSNYFIGKDSAKWRTDVPNYAKVKYANVYPGVDLIYYGNQRQLEFDLVVQPGADPKAVRLGLRGTVNGKQSALRIDDKGDLVAGTKGSEVIFHKPVVYQPTTNDETSGTKKEMINGKFVLTGAHQVRFQIAAYDRSKLLVIDPTLAYSTFLGGIGDDSGNSIALDAMGNAYVTGSTNSSNFPTTSGAFQTKFGGGVNDVFVSKLNAAGSALLYSTYLGGSGGESGNSIAVDASGNAYVTGGTNSSNFPTTPGAFQTTLKGAGDAFVSKLNATGSALLYSTYLGGSGGESGNSIAVDAAGSAYVTGGTNSSNFPTTLGAFQTSLKGLQNAFVSKLNAAGSALLYSTYLGGSGEDSGSGIAVDASDNAYLTGSTGATDFPTTPGAFQTTFHGIPGFTGNAFVSKLNAAGSALLYSTYLGGGGNLAPGGGCSGDGGGGIAIDASGNAYVTGTACSRDFPITPGAFQTAHDCGVAPADVGCGSTDAFVSKLNHDGSRLLYSTYLGGGGDDLGNGIAVDASGNAYVTGRTNHSGFAPDTIPPFPTTPDAFQTTLRGFTGNAFVSKLNATGSALLYSTYLGGDGGDGGNGIAVDASGNAYVTGGTSSSNFPTTPRAFQTTFGGGAGDAFIAKFSFSNNADLTLGKTATSHTAVPGGIIDYAITLKNLGPDAAKSVTVTDFLPAQTKFVSCHADAGGICANNGNTVTISFPAIANAHSAFITLVAQVRTNVPGGTIISNTATIASATPDPNPNNNSSLVSTLVRYASDLSIQKSIVVSPAPGELKYLISVMAPTTAHGVTVNDPLPSGTTFVSATPSQGSCATPPVGVNGTVTCSLGTMPGKTSATVFVIVQVTAPSGTTLSNTATVFALTFDPNPANNSSTITTTVGAGGGTSSVYVIQNPATFGAGSGEILEFSATATGSASPISTITAPTNTWFNSLTTDGSGNIYVATRSPNGEDVREYTAGATGSATPVRTLPGGATTRIGAVDGLAASSTGEIFVSEDSGGVAAFSATATGNVPPARYILGASQTGGGLSTLIVANAVASDSSDNLYVVNEGAPGLMPIVVFGPTATGNVAPIRTIGGPMTMMSVGSLGGITTDGTGNLYVTNNTATGGSILVFGPSASGNVRPIRSISGASTQLGFLGGIKLDSVGNIYVVSRNSMNTPTILKFSATASGNVAPISSFTSSAWTNPDNNLSLAVH